MFPETQATLRPAGCTGSGGWGATVGGLPGPRAGAGAQEQALGWHLGRDSLAPGSHQEQTSAPGTASGPAATAGGEAETVGRAHHCFPTVGAGRSRQQLWASGWAAPRPPPISCLDRTGPLPKFALLALGSNEQGPGLRSCLTWMLNGQLGMPGASGSSDPTQPSAPLEPPRLQQGTEVIPASSKPSHITTFSAKSYSW